MFSVLLCPPSHSRFSFIFSIVDFAPSLSLSLCLMFILDWKGEKKQLIINGCQPIWGDLCFWNAGSGELQAETTLVRSRRQKVTMSALCLSLALALCRTCTIRTIPEQKSCLCSHSCIWLIIKYTPCTQVWAIPGLNFSFLPSV